MKISTILFVFCFLTNLSVQSQELEYSFKEAYKVTTPSKLNITSSNNNLKVISHNNQNLDNEKEN